MLIESDMNKHELAYKQHKHGKRWGFLQDVTIVHLYSDIAIRKLEAFACRWYVRLVATQIIGGFLE
jgi:hypothetical protein